MEWIKLADKLPTYSEIGAKCLLYRNMNDNQKLLSVTIHDTRMVKHCDPNETWWMPLPELPNVATKSTNAPLQTVSVSVCEHEETKVIDWADGFCECVKCGNYLLTER